MITVATIGAWLASPIVGFFAKMLIDWLSSRRAQDMADKNSRKIGRLEVENEINAKTVEIQEAIDNVSRPSDSSITDSLQSGKF